MDSSRFSQTIKVSSEAKPSTLPSNLDGLKSKNVDLKSVSFNGVQASVHDQWSSKTPEKPIQVPRRTRTRGSVAFSVKQVKEFAKGLQTPLKEGHSDRQDQIRSNARVLSDKRLKLSESTAGLVGRSSKSGVSMKLPSKYELLGQFFDSMESSIRLLRLKGSMSTFTNICSKIESLTDRRFSFAHLAQIKYLLPEAVSIEKVLLQDEQTLCMKPELQVTLISNAFKNDKKQKEGPEYLSLRRVFRERIFSFSHAHPEEDEVPEETLPEPFNQTKEKVLSTTISARKTSLPNETSSNALPQPPAVASHLAKSFQRRFSHKVFPKLSDDVPSLSALPLSIACPKECSSNEETLANVAPPLGCSSKSTSKKLSRFCASSVVESSPSTVRQCKEMEPMNSEDHSPSEIAGTQGTPAKLILTPSRLVSITPVLQTPKRCSMSPDDDFNTPCKLIKRRPRSLKFDTPVKNERPDDELDVREQAMVEPDIDFLPESLLESIREKERKAMEELDTGVSQAKWRRQMIACLPKLFDMILLIFQSITRSVMTKEELMHKIIASHCDIIDRREVEEQLKLLEEFTPDWISSKVAASGDYLICVDKNSSPELIRSRLAEAE